MKKGNSLKKKNLEKSFYCVYCTHLFTCVLSESHLFEFLTCVSCFNFYGWCLYLLKYNISYSVHTVI